MRVPLEQEAFGHLRGPRVLEPGVARLNPAAAWQEEGGEALTQAVLGRRRRPVMVVASASATRTWHRQPRSAGIGRGHAQQERGGMVGRKIDRHSPSSRPSSRSAALRRLRSPCSASGRLGRPPSPMPGSASPWSRATCTCTRADIPSVRGEQSGARKRQSLVTRHMYRPAGGARSGALEGHTARGRCQAPVQPGAATCA